MIPMTPELQERFDAKRQRERICWKDSQEQARSRTVYNMVCIVCHQRGKALRLSERENPITGKREACYECAGLCREHVQPCRICAEAKKLEQAFLKAHAAAQPKPEWTRPTLNLYTSPETSGAAHPALLRELGLDPAPGETAS
jgi:hypothetical protein